MKRKTALAGAAAVVTGVGMGVIGFTSSPAGAAPVAVSYTCALTPDGGQVINADVTADFTGTAPAEVEQTNNATLSGIGVTFHVSPETAALLAGAGVEEISSGTIGFTVAAVQGAETTESEARSGSTGNKVDPVAGFTLAASFDDFTVTPKDTGKLSFVVSTPVSVMLVTAGPNEPADITGTCTTDGLAVELATTTVKEKPTGGGTTPPGGTNPGDTGGGNTGGGTGNGGGGDNNGTGGGGGGTGSGGGGTTDGGGLARTGVDNTLPLTGGGIALIVLGAGALIYSRRRFGQTAGELAD